MTTLDPASVAQKWVRNLTAAVPTIKAGVMSVTQSPMAQAASKAQAYIDGVTAAVQSGKWQAGLLSVSLSAWQDATANKGTTRIASGAQQAQSKVQDVMSQLLPYAQKVSQTVQAMPKGTLDDSIARATKAITMMAQFKYRKSSS